MITSTHTVMKRTSTILKSMNYRRIVFANSFMGLYAIVTCVALKENECVNHFLAGYEQTAD